MRIRLAVALIAVVALAGCGADNSASEPAPSTTTSITVSEDALEAMARGVISGQATESGLVVADYGRPEFVNELLVLMWAEVVRVSDSYRTRMWFQVAFAKAGDSVVPFGGAKVALTRADLVK
ncbi:hypothetical protein AB0H76_15435 [Nocardia sp. NPDC050712]|uniref:hypothetical protein n=1 Tax=Nocardia sp. NPDC050712 TaxID=3155518 RepID=UPI0033CA8A3B